MPAFNDGDAFYYFVTARDLLGRDGLVSPGRLATACRKISPSAPNNLRVLNMFEPAVVGGVATNIQQLRLSWNQDTNAADLPTEYWIYRWNNPSQTLTNDMAPLVGRIAVVSSLTNTNANSYLDNGTNAPLDSRRYQFLVHDPHGQPKCVRTASFPSTARRCGACCGITLRRMPASGEVLGSCGTPAVMFQNFNTLTNSTGSTSNLWSYRFTCQRRDRGIAWVQFTATGATANANLGQIYFPPEGDTVSADFTEPTGVFNPIVSVTCEVGNYYGATSLVASTTFSFQPPSLPTHSAEAVFYAGQLLLTALDSSDPLLPSINHNQPECSSAYNIVRYPDGTVSMQFREFNNLGLPQQVQVLSNAAWVDVGIAWPDTNNVYWISYPACLLGPLPTFQGCVVNVSGNGDCDQHIARAADGGSGRADPHPLPSDCAYARIPALPARQRWSAFAHLAGHRRVRSAESLAQHRGDG